MNLWQTSLYMPMLANLDIWLDTTLSKKTNQIFIYVCNVQFKNES
jgi:hypothetical protein